MTEFVSTLRVSGGDYSSIQAWCDGLKPTAFNWDGSHYGVQILNYNNYTSDSARTKPQRGWAVIGQTSGAIGIILAEPHADKVVVGRTSAAAFVNGEVCDLYLTGDTLDLTAAPQACDEVVLECYDGNYGGAAGAYPSSTAIPSTVGNSATKVVIRAAAGEGHEGVLGGGFKVQSGNECFAIQGSHVRLEGLQVKCTNGSQYAVEITGGTGIELSQLLGQCQSQCGFITMHGHVSVDVNNIIIDRCLGFDSPSWPVFNLTRGVTLRNCGAFSSIEGFSCANQVLAENCVAYGNTADWDGIYDAGSRNNASGNGTPPGTSAQTGLNDADFEDYTNDNFMPANGQQLSGNGVDLSAHYTDDITGTQYVSWDIGPIVNASASSDISFDGPNITNQTATGEVPFSLSVAGKWSTSYGPITYSASPAGTAWPSWLSIDPNSGIISGTVAGASDIANTTGLMVRAEDNLGGIVDSNAFEMDAVNPPAPSFNPSLPADVTVGAGGLISLSYQATGATLLVGSWQRQTDGAGAWENQDPLVADNPFEFTSQASDNADKWRFLYWDAFNQIAYSREATITVNASAPVINPASPADVTLTEGNNAVFTAVIDSGTPPYNYQWYEAGVGAMSGETGTSLTISGVTHAADDDRQFYFEVTDQFLNTSQSRIATLAVPSLPVDNDPTLPADVEIIQNTPATFDTDIVNADGGITYQWEVNTGGGGGWTPISGATASSLTVDSPFTPPDRHGRQYRCQWTDPHGQSGVTREATMSVVVYQPLERGEITIDGDYDLFLYILGAPPSTANISADNSENAQNLDIPVIVQDHTLTLQNAEQSQQAEAVGISGQYDVVADESSQAQEHEAAVMVQQHVLSIQDSEQAQEIDVVSISVANITPDDAEQAQAVEALNVWIESITANDAEQAQEMGEPGVLTGEAAQINPDNADQSQALDPVAFTQTFFITADDSEQVQVLATANVTVTDAVEIYDAVQEQYADEAGFAFIVGVKLEADIIVYARLTGEIITY